MVVLASLDLGGVQRLVVDLLTHWDRRRVQPQLVLSKRAGRLVGAVPADCRVHDLDRRGRFDFPALVVRLARIIRSERPDVVFALQFHANLMALAARTIAGARVPVIISEHVAVESYRRGPAWVRALMRASYPRSDRAIAVSSGVGDELTREWRVAVERVAVIHNAVDLQEVRASAVEPLEARFEAAESVITSVGRFTAQKGYAFLLRAFADVRRRLPARLVLVGDGEERARLERLARELGIAPHVTWVGPDTNPYRWIARSSVFVLSSLYEGFGIALVEALALGVATIATDCPHGPAEILRGGRDGLLVPPGDERALADALMRLLTDDALRVRLARAGLRRAEDFSASNIAASYEALFESEARPEWPEQRLNIA